MTENIVAKPGEETIDQLTKQVAKGGGIAFGGSVIGGVLGFGFNILLARFLGASGYGLYVLGMSIIGIVQSVAPLGLNQGVIRFCSIYRGEGNKSKVKGTFLSAIGISVAFSTLVAFILFFSSEKIATSFFNEPSLSWVLKILAISIPFSVSTGIMGTFTQSFRRIDYQQGITIFCQLLNIILVSIAFILGFRLKGAVYGFLIAGVLSQIIAFYFLHKIFPEIISALRPNFDGVKRLLRFSLPMLFVSMSYFLALKTDRIMLGMFYDAREVGIYSAAANISLQLVLIHSALVSIFMPIISDVYNKRQYSEMKRLYDLIKRWSSYGTFFLVLPIVFFPSFIMSIYGSQFTEGWVILAVLPASYIVGTVVGPTGALLQMTGRQNIEFLNGFLMVTANITLNYLLIPIYGYFGAALATLLSAFIMNMVQVGQIYKFFRFHPFDLLQVRFIGLVSVLFAVSIIVNVFGISNFKLLVFLLGVALLLIFGYRSRSSQDEMIWKLIKTRLANSVSIGK